ncbi:hypothetical protein BBW65_07330 [Helicobacter enhydrae]|uniref:DUF5666 domain-containing protein n=1 Tax=Helicobacter enhydrae TaxID=222136 RepID=A0A1B1U776_9HELI|nr:DUF5666 domain-containing protein [Helicobacter enhydrae]ANV98619.1 hypothetical protein BBW65_07330 [Helicobacter enhydrae]
MKKLGLLFLIAGSLFAGNYGVIESIDGNNKTIKVNNTTIKVLPYTQIRQKGCGQDYQGYHGHHGIPKTFADLAVGQAVKIGFLGAENNMLVAKKIKIQCNRAY